MMFRCPCGEYFEIHGIPGRTTYCPEHSQKDFVFEEPGIPGLHYLTTAIVRPCQVDDSRHFEPSQLGIALLENALDSIHRAYQGNQHSMPKDSVEAWNWIYGAAALLPFDMVACGLGQDPEILREAIVNDMDAVRKALNGLRHGHAQGTKARVAVPGRIRYEKTSCGFVDENESGNPGEVNAGVVPQSIDRDPNPAFAYIRVDRSRRRIGKPPASQAGECGSESHRDHS